MLRRFVKFSGTQKRSGSRRLQPAHLEVRKLKLAATTYLFSLLCPLSVAWGLEIKIYNAALNLGTLEIGGAYEIGMIASPPMRLVNPGNEDVVVIGQAQIPLPDDELMQKSGCEPIPDVSWIKISGEEMILPAQGTVVVEAKLTIPKSRKYRGRRYQFNLEFRTVSGGMVDVGLKAAVRFGVKK